MSYMQSGYVKVFPSTKRGHYQPLARQTSELSITNLIHQVVDVEGYVVDDALPSSGTTGFIEISLRGYFFRVTNIASLHEEFKDSTQIFASINLSTGSQYIELMGQDDDGVYKGLEFTSSPSGQYRLLIYSRDTKNDPWKVPESSRFKFSGSSLNFIVDGGED